jgi:RNA polymerase sigma factor (sigma-70 family)
VSNDRQPAVSSTTTGSIPGARTSRGATRARVPADVVHRALAGDARAWDQIVECHQGLLWWLARFYRLSTEDAADVVQLTWLRCLEHLDQLADPRALSGWLATICRRECIRAATRRSQEVPHAELDEQAEFLAVAFGAGTDPYDEVARQDERVRLREAVAELPSRPRAVLDAMLDDESGGYADIARKLGVPVGSLGPTRNRALARLRSDPRLAYAD